MKINTSQDDSCELLNTFGCAAMSRYVTWKSHGPVQCKIYEQYNLAEVQRVNSAIVPPHSFSAWLSPESLVHMHSQTYLILHIQHNYILELTHLFLNTTSVILTATASAMNEFSVCSKHL